MLSTSKKQSCMVLLPFGTGYFWFSSHSQVVKFSPELNTKSHAEKPLNCVYLWQFPFCSRCTVDEVQLLQHMWISSTLFCVGTWFMPLSWVCSHLCPTFRPSSPIDALQDSFIRWRCNIYSPLYVVDWSLLKFVLLFNQRLSFFAQLCP